jgi:multicomponent Na+:H+ antiporter subunit A
VEPAVEAILYSPTDVQLKLWHGINVPLMLSVLTVALGTLGFLQRHRLAAAVTRWLKAVRLTGDEGYDRAVGGMMAFAVWQTRVLQGGRQHRYLSVMLVTFIVLVGVPLVAFDGLAIADGWPSAPLAVWGIIGLIVAGALATTRMRSRIGSLAAVGATGTGVALMFLVFGAPDVAMTQFMIETLSVVIAALILPRLPSMSSRTAAGLTRRRLADAGIAVVCGLVVTALVLSVTAGPFDAEITRFFEAKSVPEAFGHNIVNVILVDFRAIDTFGEIAVVAIAGLAAVGLIRQTMTGRGRS